MEKRGQVFLELLFTYGWAILAVFVSLGALTYFGVIRSDFNPEYCITEVGVSCDGFAVYESGNIFLETTNHLGKTMNDVVVSLRDKDGNICALTGASVIKPGETVTFSSLDPDDENCQFEIGKLVDLDIAIDYVTRTLDSELSHEISGRLITRSIPGQPPNCGDGVLDIGESCDDGNTVSGDGCSASCTIEPDGGGPVCGDGIVDTGTGEDCDGTNLGGQTCGSQGLGSGTLACNADCSFDTSDCGGGEPNCGNGVPDFGEQCDDGNTVSGDGCSSGCRIEFCGDVICNNGETCSSCPGDCGACPFCGDETCNGDETCSTCSQDCGACPGGGGCFLGETEIITPESSIEIQYLRPGDIIMSYNEETGVTEPAEVLKVLIHTDTTYLLINNKVRVTPNHRMLINGEWDEIGNAKIGDVLKTPDGEEVIISIEVIDADGNVQVYNLDVKNNHNYYAEGYLAHNRKGDIR